MSVPLVIASPTDVEFKLQDIDQIPIQKQYKEQHTSTSPHHSAKQSINMAETHHFDASKLFDVSGFVCVVTGGGTG
jgi:hypothetical protein